ncbi:hypothetical protein BDW_04440 [Bdellovibrio bacteriovorus W]|nr:hypothetical protein BDW_04440 [Bdellovibrio bacteriovorus W]
MDRRLIHPPVHIEKLVFGFNEIIADSLWIRAVQDFDYCEQKSLENTCINNSWLFVMLDAITNLSPYFRVAYSAGSLALTVIISDIDGATQLFEKALKYFPNDWVINYRAGYHYIYEVKDKKRAAVLLETAAKNGGPPWLYSLAGGLYSESGSQQAAQTLLKYMIQTEQDTSIIKRLQEKLAKSSETLGSQGPAKGQ